MPNPSTHTEQWATRSTIQDRLTIFAERPRRRVICTVIHPERISSEDLTLLTAAPEMAAALRLAELAIAAIESSAPDARDQAIDALLAVRAVLRRAGIAQP